jgi:hypothetical protein
MFELMFNFIRLVLGIALLLFFIASPFVTLGFIIAIIQKRLNRTNWMEKNKFLQKLTGKQKILENEGEIKVWKQLAEYCRYTGTAHLLSNVTLKSGDGTTQIDHILISPKGILVIETKHYSGWIFGRENQQEWTQVLYKKKFRFQNPIRQNYKHIRAVQKTLQHIPSELISGVIVFTKDAEFKTEMPGNVIQFHELTRYVENMPYKEGEKSKISDKAMKYCIGCLEFERFAMTEQTDVEHVSYLNRKFGQA